MTRPLRHAVGSTQRPGPARLAGRLLAAGLLTVSLLAGWALGLSVGGAWAQSAPFAAVQVGTNGCIEVGVRPDPPFNQPRPFQAPAGLDLLAGYPAFGYDPAGFTQVNGTNSCRYNFQNAGGTVIGSGYCVQWAAGQRSGTGYDPEPGSGSIRNAGFVRQILLNFWPAQVAPAVPGGTNQTVLNRNRSGVVAMAIHYFTDGIVMPPNYQTPDLYNAVATVVNTVLALGPAVPPPDPTPTIDGPPSGAAGTVIGPFTIGANAAGNVTVTVTGALAFTDPAGTVPYGGEPLAPGSQLWISSADPASAVISASALVDDPIGTLMVGDPTFRVQSMLLATPLTLVGKATRPVSIQAAPIEAALSSQVSATTLFAGGSVTDTITATGLGPSTAATLDVTLVGPVPPDPDGRCAGVDWTVTGLPVRRTFDPVVLAGDTVVTTPAETLTDPGCYSFAAGLEPVGGPAVSFAAGEPTETVLVVLDVVPSPFEVTSTVSAAVIDPGGTVSDRVTITGFPPGRVLNLTPFLVGPVAPDAGGRCDGIDWTAVDTTSARRFPLVVVNADITFTTPPTQLDAPGCYSYGATATTDLLTGGEVPVDDGVGAPSEIVLVVEPPPGPTTTTTTAVSTTTTATPEGGTGTGTLPATGVALTGLLAAGAAGLGAGIILRAGSRSGRRNTRDYRPRHGRP